MGNYRFRLSYMMPNAWFYKLNRRNTTTQIPQHPHNNESHNKMTQPTSFIPCRASYYLPSNSPLHPKALDTHFPLDSPRRSARKARKKPVSPRPISSSAATDIVFDVGAELDLPPIITRKKQCMERKQRGSLMSESFAVLKSSSDPKKDFRESMMEMIKENRLRAAKDLEELLACYLSLNSNEYHGVIVRVFEEIWFNTNY